MNEDLIIKSSDYFPPTHKDIELYKFVSELFDSNINKFVLPYINQIRGIYDPSSKYYDPDYLIKLTGSSELFNLLNNSLDKSAVVTLIPELLRIKGTQACVDVLFKLLKLGYKSVTVNEGLSGCKTLTLIIDDKANIDYQSIFLLEQLINIYMSSCVRLGAVANCLPAGITDLTTTKLSNSAVLDTMILSSSLGHKIDKISKNITFYLCNNTQAVSEKYKYNFLHYITKYRFLLFSYDVIKTNLLDVSIVLDRVKLSAEDILKHYRTVYVNHLITMSNNFDIVSNYYKSRSAVLEYKNVLVDSKLIYRFNNLTHQLNTETLYKTHYEFNLLDLNKIKSREYDNSYDSSYNINSEYVQSFEKKSIASSFGDTYEVSFNEDFNNEEVLLHYGYGFTIHKSEKI